MKKLFSVLLVLALAVALCVPAMATTGYTKQELEAKLANYSSYMTAEQNTMAANLLANVADPSKVDPEAIVAAVKDLNAKVKNSTVVAADITNAEKSINAGLNGQGTVSVGNVSIDTTTGKVNASVTAKAGGYSGTQTVSTVIKPTTSATTNTTTTNTTVTTGVIKTTGTNFVTAIVAIALSIVAVLSVATVKIRKARVC